MDDLFLDLAIERHRDLLTQGIPAHVDQRILLGHLSQRAEQPGPVGRLLDDHHHRQRRRRKLRLPGLAVDLADHVADPGLVQPVQAADLARDNGAIARPRARRTRAPT